MPKSYFSAKRSIPALRSAVLPLEFLENRTFLSVSLDGNGSTVITPEAGSKVIYCSSSAGNDANTGLSPSAPVASLDRARSLLDNNSGDQMLLKAGDTWSGNFVFWTLSGKSAQEPMVLGSYGFGPRPTVMSGTTTAFAAGKTSSPEVDFLAIMGINFVANGRDPQLTSTPDTRSAPYGLNILSRSTDLLVENCEFQYYSVNANFQDYLGPIQDVTFRRNVSVDAYSTVSHAQGLYCTGVKGLLIEGNLFDHNGYNEALGVAPAMYNQDCYLAADNTGVLVANNTFSNASNTGLQARSGGIVENNLFINDPIGLMYGLVNGAKTTPGGVSGTVAGNVFIGGANLGNIPEGIGMEIGNIRPNSGTSITANIFTDSIPKAGPAIMVSYGNNEPNSQDSVGVNDLTINGNIINQWQGIGIDVYRGLTPASSGLTALNHLSILYNNFEYVSGAAIRQGDASYGSQEQIAGNSYYGAGNWVMGVATEIQSLGAVLNQPFPFLDPLRTVATFAGAVGEVGTMAGFVTQSRLQSEQSWNANYTATAAISYINSGFGPGGAVSLPIVNPTPAPIPIPIPIAIPGPVPIATPAYVPPPIQAPTSTARSATSNFPALQWDNASGVANDNYGGLGYADSGDWAEYSQVNFGAGVTTFMANVAALPGQAGNVQLHLDSPNGALIGTLTAAPTGAWNHYTNQTASVAGATGVHDLYLVFQGGTGVANVQSFQFTNVQPTHNATSPMLAMQWTGENGIASDNFNGLGYADGGDWVEYNNINFGAGVTQVNAQIAALSSSAGTIEFHLDSPTGTLISTLRATPTGAWNAYTTQSAAVSGAAGVHDLYLTFVGGQGVANVLTFDFA